MKDTIYRDDAIKCCRNEWEEEVEERLRLLPSADVAEVVRCRDCMWNYIHVTPSGCDYHICRLMNLAFNNDDDFFCAYGEKRNKCGEPIPHWRGQMDGCLPFQTEVQDEQIH